MPASQQPAYQFRRDQYSGTPRQLMRAAEKVAIFLIEQSTTSRF